MECAGRTLLTWLKLSFARRFGDDAAHGRDDSDVSASSGVHDSAGSMSPVRTRKRRAAADKAADGDLARRGTGSLSGSDPYSSRASSSGGRHAAQNGHAEDGHGHAHSNGHVEVAEFVAPPMARVPEHEQVPVPPDRHALGINLQTGGFLLGASFRAHVGAAHVGAHTSTWALTRAQT